MTTSLVIAVTLSLNAFTPEGQSNQVGMSTIVEIVPMADMATCENARRNWGPQFRSWHEENAKAFWAQLASVDAGDLDTQTKVECRQR